MNASCMLCHNDEKVDDGFTIDFCSNCIQLLLNATPESIRRAIVSASKADRNQLARALQKYLMEDDDGLCEHEKSCKGINAKTNKPARNMDRKRTMRKARTSNDKGWA